MQPLAEEEFLTLSAEQIAVRIDAFFREDFLTRYQFDPPEHLIGTTAQAILQSSTLQAMPEPERKRAILFFYRAQFQRALCFQYSAFINQVIPAYQERSQQYWGNPAIQLINAASRQGHIVAARIGFECLMEFVHFVEKKELIQATRSKAKSFRKWLFQPSNRFGWLIFYLVTINRFDRDHRTPEVHGTSYVAIEALRCNDWPRDDGELDAFNILLNIWRSVLDTLNGRDPSGYSTDPRDHALFQHFFRWRELDLEKVWQDNANIPIA